MLTIKILLLAVAVIGIICSIIMIYILSNRKKSMLYVKLFDKTTYRIYKYVMDNIDRVVFEYSFDSYDTFRLDDYIIRVSKVGDERYSSIFLDDHRCLMGFYYKSLSTNLANKLIGLVDLFEPSIESGIIDETVTGEIYYATDKTDPYTYWLFQAGSESLLSTKSSVCIYKTTGRCAYKSFTAGVLMNQNCLQCLRKATPEEVEKFHKATNIESNRSEIIKAGEDEFNDRFKFMKIHAESDMFTQIVALIRQMPGLGRDGNQFFTLVMEDYEEVPFESTLTRFVMDEIDHYADCNYMVHDVFLVNQDALEDTIRTVKELAVKCNEILQESGELKVYKPLSDEYK